MTRKSPLGEYLVNAREAEVLAARFPDTEPFFKTSWLAIAQGYRSLAQAEQSKASSSEKDSLSPASQASVQQ
jgi:hypothetical protein